MKGLIIAYKFAPEGTVGALRPSYWAEEFENQHKISVDVITATEGTECKEYNRIVVPNTGKSVLSFLIKDEGLTWRKDILNYLKNVDLSKYDFAIITGGPFFHFSLAKPLSNAGVKVILDFRDPFSFNPRFGEKGLKKWIKQRFERSCLKYADLVITVNKECHEYIGGGLNVRRAIVPNGFDERLDMVGDLSDGNGIFYAGRFYWEPKAFFDVLLMEKIGLTHAGNKYVNEHPFVSSELYKELGFLSQKEMYKELSKSEIGVVFTMDVPFESTTKIYDYIALNKKILVVTKGSPDVGALKRELDNYPMHKWVSNQPEAIRQAISELKQMENVKVDVARYSRKHGLTELVKQIKRIVK